MRVCELLSQRHDLKCQSPFTRNLWNRPTKFFMTPKLTNDGRPGEEPNGAVMKLAVHFEKDYYPTAVEERLAKTG